MTVPEIKDIWSNAQVFIALLESFEEPLHELAETCLDAFDLISDLLLLGESDTAIWSRLQGFDLILTTALEEFDQEHWKRIQEFYKVPEHKDINAPRDELVLLFFFAFSIREFTKLLQIILETIHLGNPDLSAQRRIHFPPLGVLSNALRPDDLTSTVRRIRSLLKVPAPLAPNTKLRLFVDRCSQELSAPSGSSFFGSSLPLPLFFIPSFYLSIVNDAVPNLN